MPQTGKRRTVNKNGIAQDVYTVKFTNGALLELEELQKSIGAPNLDAVLKIAIGLTKKIEEMRRERERDERAGS